MITGAIFDFDGTLFDSMSVWDTVGSDYLRSIGYAPKDDLDRVIATMSMQQAACYFKSEYEVTLSVKEIMTGVDKMIEYDYANSVMPKPGVETFLRQLKEHGVKMCIATATDRKMIDSALKRCGLYKYFTAIFTCSSLGHGKDEPDIFRTALCHLGTKKKNTFVFEDALYAAKTAKEDDFPVVGVYDSHEENKSEVKKITDLYLKDFSDFETFWNSASQL